MALPRRRVAIVGLPAVGKSTFVHALHGKAGEQQPAPTAGCNKSSVHFDRIIFDLLDLGGSPQVRKFWGQLAGDAHAIVIMVNASEADDMSWALLASEVRRLRAGRPLLVLLNQRDVPAAACVAAADALDRLNIDPAPDVRVAGLLRASDIASAEAGLAWLAALMLGEHVEDDAPPEDDADDAQPEAPLWAAAAQALDEEQAAELQSGMAASDFKEAVVRGDINTISKIRGLGKKTAERIVLELGDKVGVKDAWQAQSARATLAPQAAAKNDALLALISLGYKQVEAQKAIEKLPETLSKPDEILRAALRLLQG